MVGWGCEAERSACRSGSGFQGDERDYGFPLVPHSMDWGEVVIIYVRLSRSVGLLLYWLLSVNVQ